jgi:serine/threonine protein kinase
MAERAQDRINLQLGNYRLQRPLGHGGFADVFLGQHVFLNTEAAIKVLHTQLRDKDLDKFLQEARTIAHLTHPNIIHVLDFGTYEEEPFLVMEYAPHGNLRDHHARGTIVDLQTTVSYVKQIAAGLQYAHNANLVHCDVKPENMLVGQNKQILISDFGISIVTQSTQTQSTLEEVQGTAAYMAPEQINGKPKPASDQYALGIITYEWLCGEKPFNGSFIELCNKHITQLPPPLRSKNPDITAEIEYVVMTALEKDPAKRFSSIRAFANALEQAYHATQQRLLS